MWPQQLARRSAKCLRMPSSSIAAAAPRLPCGQCSYTRVADAARIRSLHSNDTRRPIVFCTENETIGQIQKRWITQAYLQRQRDAEKQWAEFAKEIKEGKRKSFVEHLEERELIYQVVGFVDSTLLFSRGFFVLLLHYDCWTFGLTRPLFGGSQRTGSST